MTIHVLGKGGHRLDELRGGRLAFRSRRGVPPAERALIEALPERSPGRVLTGHDSEGVLAVAAATLWPDAEIHQHHLDAYVGRRAGEAVDRLVAGAVTGHVTPELPEGPFDLVALPCPGRGEALLTRDWLVQAHDRLAQRGRLLVATDVRPDWLRKATREVFGAVDLVPAGRGAGRVVTARRQRESTRLRDHRHTIELVRGDRVLLLESRPGVFSHGRLDAGTRALLDRFEAAPGERVLDLGCGIGALGLAAAVDAGPEGCVLVDSNARAVALARANARSNDLAAVEVLLRADLEELPDEPFDRVLANPPYFSNDRIARSFVRTAADRLRPGGALHLVAKARERHQAILQEAFEEVRVEEHGGYSVFTAR